MPRNNTNTREEQPRDGGAGDTASPASGFELSGVRERFPNLAAALDAWEKDGREGHPTGLRITAKVDGFRRAGTAHSAKPVDHDASDFEPEQIEALLAEPGLVVELTGF